MRPNPISLEALEVLDAIERRGSFAKAAMELNKATSAISYMVQKLEEQLDITIYQRQGRRSVLTPAGRLLLDQGRELLHSAQTLGQAVQELSRGWEPKLRVAIESIMNYEQVFEVIRIFMDEHPAIELEISETVLNGGWEALEQQSIDLLVGGAGPAPQHMGFRTQRIGKVEMLPLVAASHPLAEALCDPARVEEALLEVRRVVTRDSAISAITSSKGFSLGRHQFSVQHSGQKKVAIAAGLGIGHLPASVVGDELASGSLKVIAGDHNSPQHNVIAWRLSDKGLGLKRMVSLFGEVFGRE